MHRKQKFAEEEKSKGYISKNFKTWNFQDVLKSNVPEESTLIKFVFEFNNPNESFSLESLYGENNYITVDGNIEKLSSASNENCYCVYDRKTAVTLKDVLESRVTQILKENNLVELEEYETCFSITIVKVGKPTHLFTKEEIKVAMQNADDRFNNQLVIDENGYAISIKVLEDCEFKGMYMLVGQAIFTATRDDMNKTKVVIVRDGLLRVNNTTDRESRITEDDIGNVCFLEDEEHVTMNAEYAAAGTIYSYDKINDTVIVRAELDWGNRNDCE